MKRILLTIVLLRSLPLAAEPLITTWPEPDPHANHLPSAGEEATGHHGRRGGGLYLHDREGSELVLITPHLERRAHPLPGSDGALGRIRTGLDNYHALVATREGNGRHESALRYLYLRGKPSGESPARLVGMEKLPLELMPQPLVREHWRYLSGRHYRFSLHYRGLPVSGAVVTLATSNGSELSEISDGEGRVGFTLPDDFSEVKPGRRSNRPAEFVVRASLERDGIDYTTNLSSAYSVNPTHWQSKLGGVAMLLAGFAAGMVVLRRLPTRPADKERGR